MCSCNRLMITSGHCRFQSIPKLWCVMPCLKLDGNTNKHYIKF